MEHSAPFAPIAKLASCLGILFGLFCKQVITLFGISTRNAIMPVSRYKHLVAAEGCAWNLETALRGATERLMPILMTALVTALGRLPLAIGFGKPGHEIESPMAIVILGGLFTSTVLNRLVLPALAFKVLRLKSKVSRHDSEDARRQTPDSRPMNE